MEISLQPRLEQRLKMAPQIIQSIEILQLPLMALHERIEAEQLENPLLEIEELAEPDRPAPEERELTRAEKAEVKDEFERIERVQDDYHDYFWQTASTRPARSSSEKDEKLEAIENSPGPMPSLRDHLSEQLRFLDVPPRIRDVAEAIINNLDRDGRLCFPLEEIASSLDDPPSVEQATRALALVQSLDPAGVGARDLVECLLLQVDPEDHEAELQREVIRHHLPDIEANRYPRVAKRTGRSIEDIKDAVARICMLHPAPGRLYDNEIIPTVAPDVHVELIDDEYEVRLDDSSLPRIRINDDYRQLLQEQDAGDTKQFLQKKMDSAQWLIDAIQQRRRTILRVSREIVARQEGFLERGLSHLRPLKMQEVADAIEMHVATVSRAIRHKYMQTPRGLYPMKFFFTGGTRDADGEMKTWDAVREKIRRVIEQEDKTQPLSDEDVVKKLADDGITLARRTVTKYRKNMGIPTSRQRKRY
jgi:RNA polymerase sigma-54 factor